MKYLNIGNADKSRKGTDLSQYPVLTIILTTKSEPLLIQRTLYY
jgi:hypothetical protein